MAFNGTLHFPKQEITSFMQSLGMRFGAHVNANTASTRPIYELQIPTSSPAVMDRSLTILEDFAHTCRSIRWRSTKSAVSFSRSGGLGSAGERIRDAQIPVLLKDRATPNGLPIGKPEIIRNANHDRLKQFYATGIARSDGGRRRRRLRQVGCRGADQIALRVDSPPPRLRSRGPTTPCPPTGTAYSIVPTRSDADTHRVFTKMPARDQSTVGAYRSRWRNGCSAACCPTVSTRSSQQPNAPFLAAQTSRGIFVRTAEVTSLNALVAPGGVERGLTALFTEIDRVARFGFTATELDRQGASLQRILENAAVEKNKSPSGPLADEFIRNFLQGEPIPGIVYEYALEPALPARDHARRIECALAKEWAPDRNRIVTVSAPETGLGRPCLTRPKMTSRDCRGDRQKR
jgi:zinc protease